MSREIKFRAWNKTKKRIVREFTISPDGTLWKGRLGADTDMKLVYENKSAEHELMQYTGLKDKNGIEIYEGDIVIQYETPNNRYVENQEVYYINGTFVVGIKGDTETPLYLETNTTYRKNPCNLIEVIGNIYENKDLLDG